MRRFGAGVTEEVLRRLIREIVGSRTPEQIGLIDKLGSQPVDQSTRERLREILADELVESGLDPSDEPTERGRLIEAAIDWLGHL